MFCLIQLIPLLLLKFEFLYTCILFMKNNFEFCSVARFENVKSLTMVYFFLEFFPSSLYTFFLTVTTGGEQLVSWQLFKIFKKF